MKGLAWNIYNVFLLSVTLIPMYETLGQNWQRYNYLKRSFSYGGAKLWNNFPDSLKDVGCIVQSKRNMKISIIPDSRTAIMYSTRK